LVGTNWYNYSNGQWGGWVWVASTTVTSSNPAISLRPSEGAYYDVITDVSGKIGADWYNASTGAQGAFNTSPSLPAGATATGNPTILLRSGTSTYDIFVRSSNGYIEQNSYNAPAGTWGSWTTLGSTTVTGDAVSVTRPNATSVDDVFANNNGPLAGNWYSFSADMTGQWTNLQNLN